MGGQSDIALGEETLFPTLVASFAPTISVVPLENLQLLVDKNVQFIWPHGLVKDQGRKKESL